MNQVSDNIVELLNLLDMKKTDLCISQYKGKKDKNEQ